MKDQYFKEWISYVRHKRFAISTYKTYTSSVEWFLKRSGDNPFELSYHEIRIILLEIEEKNTVNSIITAIRQFYLHILERELDWKQLPYTVKQRKIQPIYSQENILKVLYAITNEKQKAILALIIDTGLRISEPCNILISDCNSKERRIILRSAKGDCDRTIYPSEFVWRLIKVYWNKWDIKPHKFLFEGQKNGQPYTTESIRAFVIHYCKKTGVQYLGVHAIRRCNITWCVENKIDLTVIANNVGHKNISTIQKSYLIHSPSYLKSIPSPLSNQPLQLPCSR